MDNRKQKVLQIRVSDQEHRMLGELCSRFGCGTSEMMRRLLSEKHSRTFPPYMGGEKVPKLLNLEVDMTPEQKCEKFGGKIVTVEGTKVCRFPTIGDSGQFVPLSAHKDFQKYLKK